MFANTNSEYPIALLKSIGKKSFEALGRAINRSSKTIARSLNDTETNLLQLEYLAKNVFRKNNELILAVDDSLVKKIYSKLFEGAAHFFDLKIGREIIAFKLQCGAITDGKSIMPINFSYLFSSKMPHPAAPSKLELFQNMVLSAQKQFANQLITVAADGLFSTKEILKWCLDNNIRAEMRMHSNRKVEFKGKIEALKNIENLEPKGRHKARTIQVIWHGMTLYLTAHRRQDKHGDETIVYQISTFKAKPSKHVATYKKRWGIEKMFRTTKQSLGLADCYSLSLKTQTNHISSVLLTYALAQVAQKLYKLKNTETAIRWLKAQDSEELKFWIAGLDQIFERKT